MIERLLAWSYEERVANACIGAERADLVLAGCAILEAIRRAFPCRRLRVADRGLREGMLVQMMREDGVWGGRRRRRAVTHARQRARSQGPGQDRQGPLAVLEALARAPAQRSLRRARQARRLSLARRLQADRDRRQASPAQARRAGGRSRRRARRLEPGRGEARRRGGGQGTRGRDRPPRHGADCRASNSSQLDFLDPHAPDATQGAARRAGRRRAFRHGGERHRPPQDRSSQDHGAGRGRGRLRARGAGARRRVSLQGAAGRHRGDAARRAQARFRQREARQAGGEPRRFGGALSAGDGVSRPSCRERVSRCMHARQLSF